MDKKTVIRWMVLVVPLAWFIGFGVGSGISAKWDHSGPSPMPSLGGGPVPDLPADAEQLRKDNAALTQLLNNTNAKWKETIDALSACNAQYSESTVLVTGNQGNFSLSVSPSTGHFGLQTQGEASGVWVIPQHVRRVMTLNGTGRELFYYTDLHTGKLDGPYVPLPATPKVWAGSQ